MIISALENDTCTVYDHKQIVYGSYTIALVGWEMLVLLFELFHGGYLTLQSHAKCADTKSRTVGWEMYVCVCVCVRMVLSQVPMPSYLVALVVGALESR